MSVTATNPVDDMEGTIYFHMMGRRGVSFQPLIDNAREEERRRLQGDIATVVDTLTGRITDTSKTITELTDEAEKTRSVTVLDTSELTRLQQTLAQLQETRQGLQKTIAAAQQQLQTQRDSTSALACQFRSLQKTLREQERAARGNGLDRFLSKIKFNQPQSERGKPSSVYLDG